MAKDDHLASESTCWTMIRAGVAGGPAERNEIGRRYLKVVRPYLSARWRDSAMRECVDDATQEVFVECFRQGGVLETAAAGQVPNFRAFLFGVVRNVARRFESRSVQILDSLPDLEAKESSLDRLFERSWAESVMVEAAQRQRSNALRNGESALKRVELLRLRFEENLPIREISQRWGESASTLHHDYALARKEFRAALIEVVSFHLPGTDAEIEQEAAELLRALS